LILFQLTQFDDFARLGPLRPRRLFHAVILSEGHRQGDCPKA
jgi:hypothetical protein